MVKQSKEALASEEEITAETIAPDAKEEITSTKETVDSYLEDTSKLDEAYGDVVKSMENSDDQNLNDLFDSIGCETK